MHCFRSLRGPWGGGRFSWGGVSAGEGFDLIGAGEVAAGTAGACFLADEVCVRLVAAKV